MKRNNIFSGFWLNAPAPLIRDEAHLKLMKKIKFSDVTQQLQFSINGSYLYSLQIRPKPGVKLSKWSLLESVPEMNDVNGHKGYFVMVTHGLEAPPFNVTMEFEVRPHLSRLNIHFSPKNYNIFLVVSK